MVSHAYRTGEYFQRYRAEAIANEHQSDQKDVEECNVSTDVLNVDQASAPPDFFDAFDKPASKQQQSEDRQKKS